jgi:hypothetical protein
MSFTHLEQALVLLKTYDNWSAGVASMVRQRFEIPVELIQEAAARDEEQMRTLVPEVELENYVFLAEYDMSLNAHYLKDAFLTSENVNGETAFVNFFRLTQLEYVMLRELNVIRDVQDTTEQETLKNEFDNANLLRTEKARWFHGSYANVFENFSETTVVDMMQLARCAKTHQQLQEGGQVDCSAFYIFYKQYYLPALNLCGRNESKQLNLAMKGLEGNLNQKDLINADLIQEEFRQMLGKSRWASKQFLSKDESSARRLRQGFPPRRDYPYNPLSKTHPTTHPTTQAQIYYC